MYAIIYNCSFVFFHPCKTGTVLFVTTLVFFKRMLALVVVCCLPTLSTAYEYDPTFVPWQRRVFALIEDHLWKKGVRTLFPADFEIIERDEQAVYVVSSVFFSFFFLFFFFLHITRLTIGTRLTIRFRIKRETVILEQCGFGLMDLAAHFPGCSLLRQKMSSQADDNFGDADVVFRYGSCSERPWPAKTKPGQIFTSVLGEAYSVN